MVNEVLSNIPNGQKPQLIDMCCGSGAMIIETIKIVSQKVEMKFQITRL